MVRVWDDHSAADLRRLAKAARTTAAFRRMLVLALVLEGAKRTERGVVRFRLCDLCALVAKRFGVTYHEQGLSKLIKRLGFRRISARPQHPKSDPKSQAASKGTSATWSTTRSAAEPLTAR